MSLSLIKNSFMFKPCPRSLQKQFLCDLAPFLPEHLIFFQTFLQLRVHLRYRLRVPLSETIQTLFSLLKHSLLSPCLECLNLSRTCLVLLYLWLVCWLFGVFLRCLLRVFSCWVLYLHFFNRKTHIVKIYDREVDTLPLFNQIPLTRRINVNTLLLHHHQFLYVQLFLILIVI